MIVRRRQSDFLLITQPDHARLSGLLAELVGNAAFAVPSPYELVVRAIGEHDAGWATPDAQPTINHDGFPCHVFETPVEVSLPIWSESTRLAASWNPYAGLLVSLHGMHLAMAAHAASPQQVFLINRFQHEQVEIQERLRRELGMRIDRPLQFGLAVNSGLAEEELLIFNFRLLQLMDVVSLDLCFDEEKLPKVGNIVPRPGGSAMTVEVRRNGPDEFTVKPWPFGKNELRLAIPARKIELRRYADDVDLGRAVADGSEEMMYVRVTNRLNR